MANSNLSLVAKTFLTAHENYKQIKVLIQRSLLFKCIFYYKAIFAILIFMHKTHKQIFKGYITHITPASMTFFHFL